MANNGQKSPFQLFYAKTWRNTHEKLERLRRGEMGLKWRIDKKQKTAYNTHAILASCIYDIREQTQKEGGCLAVLFLLPCHHHKQNQ